MYLRINIKDKNGKFNKLNRYEVSDPLSLRHYLSRSIYQLKSLHKLKLVYDTLGFIQFVELQVNDDFNIEKFNKQTCNALPPKEMKAYIDYLATHDDSQSRDYFFNLLFEDKLLKDCSPNLEKVNKPNLQAARQLAEYLNAL